MFILKKIITAFLLPPGIFILLALVAATGFWFRGRRGRGAGWVLVAVLLWAPATAPFSDLLRQGLVADYKDLKRHPGTGDVIVLLGGGTDDRVRDLTGMGMPTGEYMIRIVTAVRLQKRLAVPIIVTGGAVYDQNLSEAAVTRRFLTDLGVPAHRILLEEKSRDTFENATLTRDICRKSGFEKPILVTSDFHMKRAAMTFAHAGLPVSPCPVRIPAKGPVTYGWWDWLPGTYDKAASYFKEYLGLAYYRMAYF
jgi:uncharacterized SAM-binding protein YcdF (DUF218 family)